MVSLGEEIWTQLWTHWGRACKNPTRRWPAASWESSGETKPAETLILDFWPPELWKNHFCWLSPQSGVLCYSSPSKWVQHGDSLLGLTKQEHTAPPCPGNHCLANTEHATCTHSRAGSLFQTPCDLSFLQILLTTLAVRLAGARLLHQNVHRSI